jgi:hypothetical protein
MSKVNDNTSNSNQKTKSNESIQLVKNLFYSWSSRVDINNYNKIFEYQGNVVAQIVWIVIFLTLCGLTILLMQMSISAYLSYSVTTKYNIIHESATEFIAITMCAGNPFSSHKAIDLFTQLAINNSLDLYNNITDLIILAKMHAANPSYGDANRKELGLKLDNIVSCTFNNKNCKNDLHWIWLYEYGNCFQFNTGLNFSNGKIDFAKISRPEPDFSLNVRFNFIFNEISATYKAIAFPNFDFVAFIHNGSNKVSSSSNLFYFPFNYKLRLSIGRTFIHKYLSPYSDCIDLRSYSSDLFDYMIKEEKYTYRQTDCLDLCMQQNIINACNCYHLKYSNLNSHAQPCLSLKQFNCAESQISNFNSTPCISSSCPLECTSIKYVLEYSIGNPRYQPEQINVSDSITSLNVFYPSLEYTEITETPQITLINLLTQLGGSLGMFISFSVFTLFEMIEIVILILHAFIFRRRKIKTNTIQAENVVSRF